MNLFKVHHGDCIEVMRGMEGNSIDAIVTDPPYGLGFMGKKWDALPPSEEWARECLRILKPGGHLLAFGGTRTWHRLAAAVEDAGFEIRDSIAWMYGEGFPKNRATLKPAFEPIVMARKPYKGSLAANEAVHGTGALNIEVCRISAGERLVTGVQPEQSGRWPANVILDEDTAATLDVQSGALHTQNPETRKGKSKVIGVTGFGTGKSTAYADVAGSGASRFFYVAKAPKKERPVVEGMAHPTVKPLALMRWLVRLVTPEGGTVLDPFVGSGTTIEAAILEGFQVIGIEREAEYLPLIQARIERTAA